jgi:hypothetical protein
VWTAVYFVVFRSISRQTPDSRVMQVRPVTSGGEGQARPGADALDRDERRDGPVALGLRTDPVQAAVIPGLGTPTRV